MAYTNILNTVDNVDGILLDLGFGKGIDLSSIINDMNEGKIKNRDISLFDSFEGQPEPSSIDEEAFAKGDYIRPIQPAYDIVNTIKANVCICKGWIEDTLIDCISKDIVAVAHIDLIGYESTLFSLNNVYKRLAEEGVIIIKDYENYVGVKKAVDKFAFDQVLSVNKTAISDSTAFIYKPKLNKTVTNKKVNRTWSSTLT
jgi:O-methyltransferase|tara:strand:- start:143 stop:742 length:600 start_codon:yes stop_codon:yes gene_type:complete